MSIADLIGLSYLNKARKLRVRAQHMPRGEELVLAGHDPENLPLTQEEVLRQIDDRERECYRLIASRMIFGVALVSGALGGMFYRRPSLGLAFSGLGAVGISSEEDRGNSVADELSKLERKIAGYENKSSCVHGLTLITPGDHKPYNP